MTARSLLKGMPACNLRSAIKHNSKIMIIICILQALGIPVIMGAAMGELWQEAFYEKNHYSVLEGLELYAIIGCIIFGMAVIMGIVAGVAVFRELWKKHDVDMMYALPMTGTQRFFSHYLAGAVMYLLPYVIAVIIGWIILLGGSCAIDFNYLSQTHGEFLAEACKYYLLASLGMFLLMWMYYTTTALITVCCGTIAESIYTTLLLNCLIPGTFAAVLAVICDNINEFSFEYLWQPIGYTSPIGGLIYLIYILSNGFDTYYGSYSVSGSEATDHGLIPAFIRWALIITILVVISLVAAWKLYQRRKAEAVSKPFVYLGAYYLMLTALTVLILCLLNTGIDAFGPIIILAAVIYLLMEVIRKRGFRRFWVSVISYVLTVALTIGMFTAVVMTEAFGTVYRIPALSSISSVKIEMSSPFSEDIDLEYTDKEVIAAIREVHKELADDIKQYGRTTQEINDTLRELDYRILVFDVAPTEPNGEVIESNDNSMSNLLNDAIYYTVDPETEYFKDYVIEEKYWDEYSCNVTSYWDEYNYAPTEYVCITYYTHMGTTMNRRYDVNLDQYKQLLEIIYGTQLYADSAAYRFRERIKSDMTNYDIDTKDERIPERMTMEISQGIHDGRQSVSVYGGEATLDRLADCYHRDLLNMKNDEQLTSGVYCTLSNVVIWNACTETIALLEEFGFREMNISEKFGLEAYYNEYMESRSLHMRIYAPGDYAFGTKQNKVVLNHNHSIYVQPNSASFEDIYYPVKGMDMEKHFPELYALLDAARYQHLCEEECYMLVVNGTWYAIPSEYSDLAQAVIDLPENLFEKTLEKYYALQMQNQW